MKTALGAKAVLDVKYSAMDVTRPVIAVRDAMQQQKAVWFHPEQGHGIARAEDVTIKISDEGGGIRRSGLQRIWTYLYTTADSPLLDMDSDTMANGPAVLAGYGYGLPLSRLYARYFGGDLQVISMDGYGTDAYLHLNRLGNVQEPLP